MFTLDGALRPLRHTTAGGRATFEAPASEAATALFLERIGPLVEQTEFPANTCAGTTVNGAVTVLNLSGRPAAGRVEVLVPKGWSARPAPFGEVAPGGRKRVEVSVTVPAGASRQIHDLSVVARAGATEDTRCVSLAVVPPVEVTSARVLPDGIEAGVRNRGPRTVTASCVLDVFAGAPAPPPQRKELRPGEESVLQFPVAWPDLAAARAPQTVRVIVEAEGLKTARSLAVGPPVVNGSFEGSVVNNDKPEAWPIFGCRADRLHLVSEEPFDGKACLRLDPAPGSPNVAQIVTLQPNTTYRITAAIRCSDARDNAGAVRLVACETPFKQVSTEVRLPAGDPGPAHQWRVVTGTLRTPPQILYSWLYIFNFTRNATVWADGIKVEAVP